MLYLHSIGEYFLMIKGVFGRMTKQSVLRGLILKEIDDLIMSSLGIVTFISFFIGAVVSIQTALN
ncbi:MAG: ABC transporter permease, partial [Croceibacter sp.]|nr:ABC transporter permease [Croceibacter sp.]